MYCKTRSVCIRMGGAGFVRGCDLADIMGGGIAGDELTGEGAAVFAAIDEGDIAMVIGLMEVGAWL